MVRTACSMLWRKLIYLLEAIGAWIPGFRTIILAQRRTSYITITTWFVQKWLGVNRDAYWPVHFTSRVSCPHRIRIGIGTAPGLSPGCYIQGINGIEIGDYTYTAPNVGIISANHNVHNLSEHAWSPPIRIGRHCWLGMNSVILPGVCLGDHTVVAAGAVVTKSYPDGYCVLAGVPAVPIRHIDKDLVVEVKDRFEYLGYYSVDGKSKEELFQLLGVEPMPKSMHALTEV